VIIEISENESEEKHSCFVFISDKLAEEITLTIGQAFELAYKRFLETSGKDLETQQKAIIIQEKVKKTEQELNAYKQRLVEISQIPAIRSEIEAYMKKNNLKNILDVGSSATNNNGVVKQENGHQSPKVETANIIDFNGTGELFRAFNSLNKHISSTTSTSSKR